MDSVRLGERLEQLSRANFAPLPQELAWPAELDQSRWCFSPELCSLYGTETFEQLDLSQQKRLAFEELINFFSLNIHGERALIAGLARHLYGQTFEPSDGFVHHFLDEENKHLQYFATFCRSYAGRIYPDRSFALPREYEPGEEAFLFFAKVMLFEDVVDGFNRTLLADERLPAIVRELNRLHHQDEVRHLAFGRAVTRRLYARWSARWSEPTRAAMQQHLAHYIASNLREYCCPAVYLNAGVVTGSNAFGDAHALADSAFERLRGTHARRARRSIACLRTLGALAPEAFVAEKG